MKKPLLLSAVAGLTVSTLTLSDAEAGTPAWAKKGDTIVKCAGIAKKGKNDCGRLVKDKNYHTCSGKGVFKDNDPAEWVYLPKGVCEKIAGAVIKKEKKVK